jgi:hypothetical protein
MVMNLPPPSLRFKGKSACCGSGAVRYHKIESCGASRFKLCPRLIAMKTSP